MYKKKNGDQNITMHIYVPVEIKRKLDMIADEQLGTTQVLVRRVFSNFIADYENNNLKKSENI